jgi:hypothetical protein
VTESEALALLLALLYLVECATWVPRGGVPFRAWWGRRARVVPPASLFGNVKGGLLFSHPLPPLGAVFVARPWPVSLSPDGVFGFVATAFNPGGRAEQTLAFARLDEVQSVGARGGELRVDGRVFAVAGPALAAELGGLIEALRREPRSTRARLIRAALARSLDGAAATATVADFWHRTRLLRGLANALFLHLFVVAPVAALALGLSATWPWLLAVLLLLVVAVLLAFRRAKARFAAAGSDTFTSELMMVLAPLAAIRATDLVSRDLLAGTHPLAAALALCRADEFADLAGRTLRDAHHPIEPSGTDVGADAAATEAWYRAELRSGLERLVRSAGLDPDALLAPPVAAERERSYCPRCRLPFLLDGGSCGGCGIALAPLGEREAGGERSVTMG